MLQAGDERSSARVPCSFQLRRNPFPALSSNSTQKQSGNSSGSTKKPHPPSALTQSVCRAARAGSPTAEAADPAAPPPRAPRSPRPAATAPPNPAPVRPLAATGHPPPASTRLQPPSRVPRHLTSWRDAWARRPPARTLDRPPLPPPVGPGRWFLLATRWPRGGASPTRGKTWGREKHSAKGMDGYASLSSEKRSTISAGDAHMVEEKRAMAICNLPRRSPMLASATTNVPPYCPSRFFA